jgi:predicted membrane channel-forming protein YqfA (hemolysin III family)
MPETEDRYSQDEETEHERLTRNVNELLQELRVAQAGVQFLFGFLLAVAFTEVYVRATAFQHAVHLIAVIFATASVALLTAPAAWHRMLFRRGERAKIIQVANRLAISGMACLAVAMVATVLLLTDEVLGNWGAVVIAGFAAILFALLWFVLPLRRRWDGDSDRDAGANDPKDVA